MKKWQIMVSLVAVCGIASGDAIDVTPFLGDSWYGLYFNGGKVGYLLKRVSRTEDDTVSVVEEAHFMVAMSGARQSMDTYSKRLYDAGGALLRIEMEMNDAAQSSSFIATVEADGLHMKSLLGGAVREEMLPKPTESLEDALRQGLWARRDPKVGDVINFSAFEPLYQKEVSGISRITGIETRIFNGVSTKVYEIESVLDLMDIETTSYVTETGVTVEDVISTVFTTRLEPEQSAKDVEYSVDTMISNAVLMEAPIENPRKRDELHLVLHGPLRESHLLNDLRQSMRMDGEQVLFHATTVDVSALNIPRLPVTEESLSEYTEPSTYIQSDAPEVLEKARDIIGKETDALKVARKLCEWVSGNMRNVFSARLSNTLEALESLEGDCTEHTMLFVGLARAVGLPAREVAGLIYVDNSPAGFYFHQWASVWLGEWVDADPAFNQVPVDVTHIKLSEGDLFRQAKILPLIGRLKIEATEAPPAQEMEKEAEAGQ